MYEKWDVEFILALVLWYGVLNQGGGLEGAKRYVSQGRCSTIFLQGSKYECATKGTWTTWCGLLVSSKILSSVLDCPDYRKFGTELLYIYI